MGKVEQHGPLGATLEGCGVTFRVWAPHASEVSVVGDFNDWSPDANPMTRGDGDLWHAHVANTSASSHYRYQLQTPAGSLSRIDPYARAVTNSVGNGVVYDPEAFDWEGDEFSCPPHHELVIYETHIGSFVATEGKVGDLASLAGRLDYLQALGVNALELMPVAEFAGDYSWGYNPAHPFAVESSYGGPDALKALVKEAHRHGIAVILDVVYNHFGPSDIDLWQFDGWSENDKGGIYFYNDHRSSTPWGDTRPDYGRREVRRYILDNALFWLREFHVDGLRLDMTVFMRSITGMGVDIPEGWTMLADIARAVRDEFPGAIVIAEDLQNEAAVTAPDGAACHSQWDARFVHPMREALIAASDQDRSIQQVAAAVTAKDHDAFARVVYTESHDEVANGKARVPQEIDPSDTGGWAAQKRSLLGGVFVLTAPGIPMLFQGQEFFEDEWFRDSVPLDWDRARQFRDVVRAFADLIALRLNADGDSAGLSGQHTTITHADEAAKTLAYARSNDSGQHVVVVANLADQPREPRAVFPHAGTWRLRFNSDAATYSSLFGDHPSDDVEAVDKDGKAVATVPVGPYSAVIYTSG